MIFEFSNKLTEIKLNEHTDKFTAAYFSQTEFKDYLNQIGSDYPLYEKYIRTNFSSEFVIEKNDNELVCTLRIIDPEPNSNRNILILILIKSESVIVTEATESQKNLREQFIESAHRFSPDEYTVEKFISAFIDSLIKNDNRKLEEIEFDINRIEDKIISDNNYKNFNEELLRYKQKLLLLRNYYKQLITICEVFEEKNMIFHDKNNGHFENTIKKTEKLCSEVSLLRENLVQLRETYQSHLDLKLNNTMKIFTIITAFFAPLTLIVGWYGMNFESMPELEWKYGYLFVIVLSVCSVISCLFIFKRKKMM